MYGFGDVEKPDEDTTTLVDELLSSFISDLTKESTKLAAARDLESIRNNEGRVRLRSEHVVMSLRENETMHFRATKIEKRIEKEKERQDKREKKKKKKISKPK